NAWAGRGAQPAGVVRKRLGLDLRSEKVDGDRTYRIVHSGGVALRFPPFASSRCLSAMPRVVIDRAVADGASLDNEIARLRGLDVGELRARLHTMCRRVGPPLPAPA